MPRIHHGGGWSPFGSANSAGAACCMTILSDEQQDRCQREAEQRRQQQRLSDIGRLRPVHAGGAVAAAQQRVGDADADDRTDQGVRTGGGQAEIPGSHVPDDGRDQQREHHGKARAAADLQDQLDRQQRHDAERDRAGRQQDAEQIEHAGPHHGNVGGKRAGVDHRGHRVGRVVEAVDEFEAERDQQCDKKQEIGQVGRDLGAGRVDVDIDAVGDEQQRGRHDPRVDDARQRMKAAIEVWSLSAGGFDRTG